MYLDLTDVLRGPGVSSEKPITIPAGPLDEEWELLRPATGWVRATNARRNVVVRGEADVEVRLDCGRCLNPYGQELHLELDVAVPLSTWNDLLGAAAVAPDDDDSGEELTKADIAALFPEHALDVNELVRQAIVLAAPIRPLCTDDCPGLPEAAQYREVEGDPRWAVLRAMEGPAAPPHEGTSEAGWLERN